MNQCGRLILWGENQHGECDVPADLGEIKDASLGKEFSVVIQTDGKLRCWGNNYLYDQCTIPVSLAAHNFQVRQTIESIDPPEYLAIWNYIDDRLVEPSLWDAREKKYVEKISVDTTGHGGVALTSDEMLLAWGEILVRYKCRELNDNPLFDISKVRDIKVNDYVALFLLEDGSVFQVDDGSGSDIPLEIKQAGRFCSNEILGTEIVGGIEVIDIGVGNELAVVLLKDRTVRLWGSGGKSKEFQIPDGLVDVIQISVCHGIGSDGYICALREDGRVICWGQKQIGRVSFTYEIKKPPGSYLKIKQIDTNEVGVICLLEDGTVYVEEFYPPSPFFDNWKEMPDILESQKCEVTKVVAGKWHFGAICSTSS